MLANYDRFTTDYIAFYRIPHLYQTPTFFVGPSHAVSSISHHGDSGVLSGQIYQIDSHQRSSRHRPLAQEVKLPETDEKKSGDPRQSRGL